MTTTNRVLAGVLALLVTGVLVAAVLVTGVLGGDTSPTAAPSSPADPTTSAGGTDPSPSTPPVSSGSASPAASPSPAETPSETAGPEQPGAYVLASADGVERRVGETATTVSDQGARIAYGVDDLVAYEPLTETDTGDGAAVRVWSPRDDRPLDLGDGADSARLLGAGSLEGRPVALVAEDVPGGTPQQLTDRLVAVDLVDGSRTVFSRGTNAFESGWDAAHLLPGGDVVATRFTSVTLTLQRLVAGGPRAWSTVTAQDRPVTLAAIGERVVVVAPTRARSDADAAQDPDDEGDASEQRTLRLDTHDLADGSRSTRQRVVLTDAPSGRLRCLDWTTPTTLSCSTAGGAYAVVVTGQDAGAVSRLSGAQDAVATAVATTG